LDEEMLALTADLLSSIPEFSTLWNIRRELIEDWAANRLHVRCLAKEEAQLPQRNTYTVHHFIFSGVNSMIVCENVVIIVLTVSVSVKCCK